MILEEGNWPYPRYPNCEMFVSHNFLNGRHLVLAFWQQGEESKWISLAEDEAREGTEAAITAYGIPLALVTSFNYLGIILSAADGNWPDVVINLRRARQKWTRMTRVLSREGTDAWTLGQIYLAVVQSVMMYGSETWVMTPHIGIILGGFQDRVALRLTGRQPWRGRDGVWVYPPLEDTTVEVGL